MVTGISQSNTPSNTPCCAQTEALEEAVVAVESKQTTMKRITGIALMTLSAVVAVAGLAVAATVQLTNLVAFALGLGWAAAGAFAMVKIYNSHINPPKPVEAQEVLPANSKA